MSTPPRPSFHSFNSPYGSSFGLHTPDTGSSFDGFSIRSGSSRHSDSTQPKIETREPSLFNDIDSFSTSRPSLPRTQTTPVTMSSPLNKDYLHFKFRKVGAKWDDEITVEEIPAPEPQIKKLAESKNNQGTALQQLRKMGANRRARIDEQIRILNADGSTWEPVYISSTKMITRPKESIVEVREFETIFARKQLPIFLETGGSPLGQPPMFQTEAPKAEFKDDKAKKEKRRSKDREAEKLPGLTDDPFGTTSWFDPRSGAALGSNGSTTAPAPGLPQYIPEEKPIGAFNMPPRIINVGANILGDPMFGDTHNAAGTPGPNVDATAHDTAPNGLPFLNDDDVIPIREKNPRRPSVQRDPREGSRKHKDQSQSRSRSISRSRPHRASFRQSSDSPNPRNVRFQDSRFAPSVSSGSSVVSGDTNSMYEEVEELSSHTSEDTYESSPGPRHHRYVRTAPRQHKPGPVSPSSPQSYELVSEEVGVTTGKGRRRNPRETPRGLEQSQPLTKRNTSPRLKPIITQTELPHIAPTKVPPFAEHPDFYEEEDRQQRESQVEQDVNSYIHQSIKREELREREQTLEQRERAFKEQREQQERQREAAELREQLGKARLSREFGTSRQTVYTHEPRNRQ